MTIRPIRETDLPGIAAIQTANPQSAQWRPVDYLSRESYAAEEAGAVIGFLVLLPLTEDEAEVLNIAVDPAWKRRGVGRALIENAMGRTLFLEVRDSNAEARAFYGSLGFTETGRRGGYYSNPTEDAILLQKPVKRGQEHNVPFLDPHPTTTPDHPSPPQPITPSKQTPGRHPK